MAWTFRCRCGEERGIVRTPARPTSDGYDCDDCGAARARGRWVKFVERVPPTFVGNLKPEIQPHFNRSLGCHVEGRKHLEYLQQKHGVRDYSPSETRPVPTDFK